MPRKSASKKRASFPRGSRKPKKPERRYFTAPAGLDPDKCGNTIRVEHHKPEGLKVPAWSNGVNVFPPNAVYMPNRGLDEWSDEQILFAAKKLADDYTVQLLIYHPAEAADAAAELGTFAGFRFAQRGLRTTTAFTCGVPRATDRCSKKLSA